jgi:hypothetical protein
MTTLLAVTDNTTLSVPNPPGPDVPPEPMPAPGEPTPSPTPPVPPPEPLQRY